MISPISAGRRRPTRRSCAFSLVEIMVAMSLLVLIVVGLMGSLNQTQKALKLAGGQTDTMENGRAFMSLLSRELQEIVALPEDVRDVFRFISIINSPTEPLMQILPGITEERTNLLSRFGFVTLDKEQNRWRLILYDIQKGEWESNRMSSIHRMETNFPLWMLRGHPGEDLLSLQSRFHPTNRNYFSAADNTNLFTKIIDGVVTLRFHAYDTNGARIPDWAPNLRPSGYYFTNPAPEMEQSFFRYRPSSIEVELAVLDPEIQLKVKSMGDPGVASQFLRDRAGNVQVFRQRISVPTGP